MKKYNSVLALLFLFGLAACFDERDDEYDIVGAVATIPVFEISDTTPSAGDEITVSFRYYSEHVAVSELRLLANPGGVVTTKSITGHNLEDSYEDSFTYTVPADTDTGMEITLTVEIETANDLVNSKSGTITVQ